MKSRFLQNLNELPGPVWLFGAFGISRLAEWLFALLLKCVGGDLWLSWGAGGMQLLGLAAALLPVGLFVCLVQRRPCGMPLVRWYAGLQMLAHGISVIAPLFTGYDPESAGGYMLLVRAEVLNLVWAGLWFCFLYYLEHSRALASLMPPENRRALWWTVVPMGALVFFCM